MVIGSLATLDLSMVVDLIGIFELKGPYYTLTIIDWFLQGPNCYFGLGGLKNYFDIIMFSFVNCAYRFDLIVDRDYDVATTMDLKPMFTGPGPDPGPLTCYIFPSPPPFPSPSSSPVADAVVARRLLLPYSEVVLTISCKTTKELIFRSWTGLEGRCRSTIEMSIPSWNWSEPGT
ncbi:hypothetical protein F511_41011 [Dorcoceras hygrometricum]|uniref:Uncharacterized protein n=1 Tax=Dorcoceras hygrometricum TaxID=472368 RepID=A0A2Z7CA15_9LAMI|nr:hypothetical protein F511_41011 [Dorcoceras hygrometricum]